jgi:3-oxoadipate enol-lactonase
VATARVNGIDLYYEAHGRGAPLLLVPGLGSDVRMFAQVVSALAERCHVVAFDPRGGGRSEKPDIKYTIEQMADDAAGLLGLLGVERATVVGYSMGGRIALSLALGHAGLVARLVLAATAARTPPGRRVGWRWFLMDVLERVPLPKSVDPQPRYAFERQRQATREFDCTSRLGEVRAPTLVLHGRDDHVVPLYLAEALRDGIPGSRMVTVPGGHLALITSRRRRFVEEILAFCSSSPPGQ